MTTILVVEDEPDIRQFLRSSLGAEGYRVVESGTGERGNPPGPINLQGDRK